MNHDETIKVAYGIGCIATMKQAGVDPAAFCKQANVSGDDNLVKMADAVASVYRHNASNPAYAEKVAAVAFDKTAGGRIQGAMDAVEGAGASLGSAFRSGRQGTSADVMPHLLGTGGGRMGDAALQAAAFAGKHPYATGIPAAAAGLGGLGAAGYGVNEAMQEDPWYEQAADAAGLGDLLG